MSDDIKTSLPHLTNESDSDVASLNDGELHTPTGNDSNVDVHKEEEGVDVVVGLFAIQKKEEPLDPERARYLRNKLDRHLLPLLFILYLLQFMDKNSLGATAILGIMTDGHLTPNQFNNLGSAFYGGYLVFVGPHAFLMQRFPIGKYIAFNIFLWAVILGLQCLCTTYGGFFACRFLLGASEGCITTGIMTIVSMFYTRVEIGERLGWTLQCSGIALIITGFISFGVAHVDLNSHPRPWQWFMILISILSLLVSLLYFWRMPDNPTSAVFLTADEKRDVVKRIRMTQNGIESKVWKKYQFIEAFKDPKSYVFFVFAVLADLVGSLGIQYQQIIKGMGFTTLQSTILNVPAGVAQIIGTTLGGIMLRRWQNGRTLISAGSWLIAIVGGSILVALPLKHKEGLLVCYYIIQLNGPGFVMMSSLCVVVTSGHTKKMTVNAIFLAGYAVGQILGPQFWKVQYRPRNVVPWIILLCSYCSNLIIVLFMRWYLSRENKRRDAEKLASGVEYEEFGYVDHVMDDGTRVKVKVPIQYMDVTDFENKAFRYAL